MSARTHNFLAAVKAPILMGALLLSVITLLPSKSFAHNTAVGCGSTSAITISDQNNWATLCSQTVDLTDGTHNCVADGSAEVFNDVASGHNIYRFTVAKIKNPATDQTWERRVDVTQGSGDDPIRLPVSTVHHFSNLSPGSYTFFWLARPFDSLAENIDVVAYSMGVVCTDGK